MEKDQADIKICEGLYEKCTKYFLESSKESSEKFGDKFFKFFKVAERMKQLKIKIDEDQKK